MRRSLPVFLLLFSILFTLPALAGFKLTGNAPSAPIAMPSLEDAQRGPGPVRTPPEPFNDLPQDSALPLAEVPPVPLDVQGMGSDDGMSTIGRSASQGGYDANYDGAGAQYDPSYGGGSGTFTAARGEDLYTVVQRWSQSAGQDVTYASATQVRLDQDFTYTGSLEAAVMALLAANPQAGLTVSGM
jgi:hypothetical protein